MPKTRGVSKAQVKEYTVQSAVNIYHWIEENKHKYPNGITNSLMFSQEVIDYFDGHHPSMRFPSDLKKEGSDRYLTYVRYIARLKNQGYLRYRQEQIGKPRTWSVNEAMLPLGTITYTGVKTPIPMNPEPEPEPNVALRALDKATGQHEGKSFIEEELKNITLEQATIRRKGMAIALNQPTLYQLYKLGLTLNEISEPEEEHEPETPDPQQSSTELSFDRILDAESEQEDTPACETGLPF